MLFVKPICPGCAEAGVRMASSASVFCTELTRACAVKKIHTKNSFYFKHSILISSVQVNKQKDSTPASKQIFGSIWQVWEE